ncbi:metallophosphoesterase [Nannocystis sp.]|uniref:metallophosphoesterase family protein n=1 Tax=Nannocystis sp. TaxID=1962667 RepID=UPI0025F4769B|nr:metallophosphoesterase [Nannocystis sp.]
MPTDPTPDTRTPRKIGAVPSPTPLRRFAAIGDVHAEDARLAHVLTWLSGQDVEAVLSVGDIVDGAGDHDRCCALLRAHAAIVVRGNHERAMLANPFACQPRFIADDSLAFLAALPVTRRMPTLRGELMLCHGVGDNDHVRLHPQHQETSQAVIHALDPLLADAALRLVVAGHTHRRMVRSFPRPVGPPLIFVNPGTLHRGYPASVAIVDLGRGQVEFHEVLAEPGSPILVQPAEVVPLRA